MSPKLKRHRRYTEDPNQTSGDKNYSVWWKYTVNANNGRLEIAEEKIHELEDTAIETTQNETQRKKMVKKKNKTISELQDNFTCVLMYMKLESL